MLVTYYMAQVFMFNLFPYNIHTLRCYPHKLHFMSTICLFYFITLFFDYITYRSTTRWTWKTGAPQDGHGRRGKINRTFLLSYVVWPIHNETSADEHRGSIAFTHNTISHKMKAVSLAFVE